MIARCAPLLAGAMLFTGCVIEHGGPTQYDAQTIERDAAEMVHVNLKIGAGKLRVSSTNDKLMRADFEYNVPSWKPEVSYSSGAGNGHLTISQPSGSSTHVGNSRNSWDVRLNRDVPLDVSVNLGAGEARLNLGALTLRNVDVQMGVGQVEMDLRGEPKRSYDVNINGGVGEATIHLPANVGITADAHGGIGEITTRGLTKENGSYRNQAYGTSKTTIHLNVNGGVGSIHLIAD